MPVEIKSGTTISDDFFKGLRTFTSQLPQISIPSLVYGGTGKQKRSDVLIWQASDVAEMMAKIN